MNTEYNPKIIILGAGVGGIGMAIKLMRAGFDDVHIIERGDQIGGTWWWNQYPGLAIDICCLVYSLSFEPNPNWSREFATREEIQQYIEHCAKKYHVMERIHFNTELKNTVFNEQTSQWELNMIDGKTEVCDVFISAPGPLCKQDLPDIAGIEKFQGKIIQSANWDHDYDMHNKKVAIVGTGASAVQIIPSIAPQVGHLTIFQRRAPWIIPKKDFEHSALRKFLYRNLPFTMKMKRFKDLVYLKFYLLLAVVDKDLGGKLGELCRRHVTWVAKRYRNKYLKDPELNKKATPDYNFGCKRMCWSDHYYKALARDNITLVTQEVKAINEQGVLTDDGTVCAVDAIILATGYDLLGYNFEYVGRNGVTIPLAFHFPVFQAA